MKKIITMAALIFSSILTYACTDGAKQKPAETQETTQEGSVIVMNKDMFIKDIFDYEKTKEWKYKGDKPAIIDLYADWCGPCRMTAPIMKELAKEYAGKIVIYKVNVDKEKNWLPCSMPPVFLYSSLSRCKANPSCSAELPTRQLTRKQLMSSC